MAYSNHLSSTETNFRRQSRLVRMSTEGIEQFTTQKKPEAMQKHFRTTSDDGLRLKSESIIVNRRRKVNISELVERRKGKRSKVYESTEFQTNHENKCAEIEKEINKKGKLDTKHVEEWLNTLLVEYCYEERFDKTVRLSALKKFQIDRNSLLSKLLSHQEIDRLYRSLLVYSVGFNRLLKDVSKNSFVTKSIWRVYSLLIEYCAQGSFQSMVAEIERQKVLQLNQLQEEVDSKDKLLDNLNQAEKVNRAKAYKELKHLKQEHIQLKNEKAIIEEDFKQADQAFNEQVNLRLKFQHKINEVNGVHRQLGMKHLLLFQDFETYKTQYQKLYQEKQSLVKKVQQVSTKLFKEENNRREAQAKERGAQEIIKNLHDDSELAIMKIKNEEKNKRNQFLSRKELQITHLNHQITTLRSTLELREKGLENRIHQINILISENENLHKTSQDQKTLITQLQTKQSNYQNRTVDLKTQTQIMQSKIEAQIVQSNQLKQQISKLKSALSETQLNLKSKTEIVELMKANGKSIDLNLIEMKQANNKLETELTQMKNKAMSLDELASNRESLYGKAKVELKQQTDKCNQLEFNFKQLETQFKLQKKSNQKTIQSLKAAIADLQSLNSTLEESNIRLQKGIDKIEVENYQLRMNDQRTKSNLRDEKFERKQIDLQFKQSLLLVSDEKNLVRELTIEITEVKDERDKALAEIKSMVFFHKEKQNNLNNKIAVLQNKLMASNKINSDRAQHVHPMIYEDIRSQYMYSIERFNTINYLHQQLIKSLGPKEEEINKKLKRLKRQYEFTQNEFKAEMDRKLMAKEKQLDDKSRLYDMLMLHFEQIKKDLGVKNEYITIIEQKYNVESIRNKELEAEKERLKERNQDLNRNNHELKARYEGLQSNYDMERVRMKDLMEEERNSFNVQINEMQIQWKRNQSLRSSRSKSKEKLNEEDENNNETKNALERIGNNENNKNNTLNPESPALIRNNPNNRQNQLMNNKQCKSNQKSNLLYNQSSYKTKSTNFSRTHKPGQFNTSSYTQHRADTIEGLPSNNAHSAEKQITRKIKHAVSYYSRPPNK